MCICINRKLLNYYNVEVIDREMDGIIGIKCLHKIVDLTFAVYCYYLPPEDSPWGRDSDAFFGHLLAQMYLNSHLDHLFVCGDVNAKLGTC